MRWLVIFCVLSLCAQGWAQRTTRAKLRLDAVAEAVGDTIFNSGDTLSVSVRGFEKSLRSRSESLFISNGMPADILKAGLEIEYSDVKGRQLHKREVEVEQEIPAGETRMCVFPAWDKQQVWYYVLSYPPRTRMQATPFGVKIRVAYVIVRSF